MRAVAYGLRRRVTVRASGRQLCEQHIWLIVFFNAEPHQHCRTIYMFYPQVKYAEMRVDERAFPSCARRTFAFKVDKETQH